MSVKPPGPETTLAVLLGASDWPRHSQFQESESCRNSAKAFRQYVYEELEVPYENVLDYFDSDEPVDDITFAIKSFLKQREKALKDVRDIVIHYVGHGGFTKNRDYVLTTRRSNENQYDVSAIPVRILATTVRQALPHVRRYLILDCCFAAAAFKYFQANFLGASLAETALKIAEDAFPPSGTALLCSSSAEDVSRTPEELKYTMFSSVLLDVLRNGIPECGAKLTLDDICHWTQHQIRIRFPDDGVRPQALEPEQSKGFVGRFPFFPNKSHVDSSFETENISWGTALPIRSRLKAMCIQKSEGEWLYQSLTDIHAGLTWREAVRPDGESFHWWRFEVKVPTPNRNVKSGHSLVMTQYPYGNGWIQISSFKGPFKKRKDLRPSPDAQSLSQMIEATESFSHDFWEFGKFLTAGVSDLTPPVPASNILRNVSTGVYVLGVCENYDLCIQELFQDKHVTKLLEKTKQNKIKFTYRSGRGKPPSNIKLFDEVIEDRMLLMTLAIKQALAGPHANAETWIGRTVVEKIDDIYRDHLNARNKALSRRPDEHSLDLLGPL